MCVCVWQDAAVMHAFCMCEINSSLTEQQRECVCVCVCACVCVFVPARIVVIKPRD